MPLHTNMLFRKTYRFKRSFLIANLLYSCKTSLMLTNISSPLVWLTKRQQKAILLQYFLREHTARIAAAVPYLIHLSFRGAELQTLEFFLSSVVSCWNWSSLILANVLQTVSIDKGILWLSILFSCAVCDISTVATIQRYWPTEKGLLGFDVK